MKIHAWRIKDINQIIFKIKSHYQHIWVILWGSIENEALRTRRRGMDFKGTGLCKDSGDMCLYVYCLCYNTYL